VAVGSTGGATDIQPAAQPRRRPIRWLAAALLLVAIAVVALLLLRGQFAQPQYGIAIDDPEPAVDFTLDSSLGKPVALSDFRGKAVLLYFGYTTCPDVCPTTLADLRQMKIALGADRDKVQVLFVSVDPARDTAERMGAYLEYFDPTFVGITDTPERIEEIASRYGVFYEKRDGATAADYFVDHTSAVLAVDPEGYLKLMFPYGVTGDQMAGDVRLLIR
jgi:protein SCO1